MWFNRLNNSNIALSNVVEDVKQRRWRWFGHVLMMNKNRDIHAQHSDGHHQEKGREAGHLALGEEP